MVFWDLIHSTMVVYMDPLGLLEWDRGLEGSRALFLYSLPCLGSVLSILSGRRYPLTERALTLNPQH